MILVNSSDWINYFNGKTTNGASKLQALISRQKLTLGELASACASTLLRWRRGIKEFERIAVGDMVLTEVLQGFSDDAEFALALNALSCFDVIEIAGPEVAIQAVRNFRVLRQVGVTPHKAIDTLIATPCIESNHELLSDGPGF